MGVLLEEHVELVLCQPSVPVLVLEVSVNQERNLMLHFYQGWAGLTIWVLIS